MNAQRLRPLVEAFVWPIVFFETCDDDTLDPDDAVRQQENIAAALNQLDDELKALVVEAIENIARDDSRPEIQQLVRAIPYHIGLVDGDPFQA